MLNGWHGQPQTYKSSLPGKSCKSLSMQSVNSLSGLQNLEMKRLCGVVLDPSAQWLTNLNPYLRGGGGWERGENNVCRAGAAHLCQAPPVVNTFATGAAQPICIEKGTITGAGFEGTPQADDSGDNLQPNNKVGHA